MIRLYRYRCDKCGREFWDYYDWGSREIHLCEECADYEEVLLIEREADCANITDESEEE